MGRAMAVEANAGRGVRKSQMTRQRLLDSANRLFRANGYAATTAAAIAEDAGVTERTFYRYFPAKADVLLTNWQRRRDVLNRVLGTSDRARRDRRRARGHARIRRARSHRHRRWARQHGPRLHRPRRRVRGAPGASGGGARSRDRDRPPRRPFPRDFEVRTAAYATVGVFRASLRAVVAQGDTAYITAFVDEGMDRLQPLTRASTRRRHELVDFATSN